MRLLTHAELQKLFYNHWPNGKVSDGGGHGTVESEKQCRRRHSLHRKVSSHLIVFFSLFSVLRISCILSAAP